VTELVRVGTRRSRLARLQTDWVVTALQRAAPDLRLATAPIDTSGDRDRSVGGSPDFTDAIDQALLRGTIDLAVHSAKDLPVELDARLTLAACPDRADPRDCLVVSPDLRADRLPQGARVGSSSLRRRAQLLRWRRDLEVVEIRGNVDTRIDQVHSGAIDTAILAVAGISRLGREKEIARILTPAGFLPAPAQGALAIVTRSDDAVMTSTAQRIDRRVIHACVAAERAFAAALGGDCRVPLGALASPRGAAFSLVGEVLSTDGRVRLRSRRSGPISRAEETGRFLGQRMLDRGAAELLAHPLR
jgi:hydroxymethylbilane synthase